MSHIFISYKRQEADIRYRDNVVKLLKDNDFHDIWFDNQNISIGKTWAEEIDNALDTASLVIVIVTEESLKSSYILYEWSRATGRGVNILPVTLEKIDTTTEPIDKHPLYLRTQLFPLNLSDGKSKRQFTELVERNLKPQLVYRITNGKVARVLLQVRVRSRAAFWLYRLHFSLPHSNLITHYLDELMTYTWQSVRNIIQDTIPKLVFEHQSHLTPTQTRNLEEAEELFNNLLQNLQQYLTLQKNGWLLTGFSLGDVKLFEEIRTSIEAKLSIFTKEHSYYYDKFDGHLKDIEDGTVFSQPPPFDMDKTSVIYDVFSDVDTSKQVLNMIGDTMRDIKKSL